MRKLKNSELDRKSIEEFKASDKTPIIIVLDNVRSLNNIGSVFRTSDALLIEAVYLCGITATPPHRELHKTALGAEDSVKWKYFKNTEDAITKLMENGFEVYSVEQAENSISLENFETDTSKKYALIFGNEVKGVQQKIVDASYGCIEIPQFGTKHSFNISVSCGIVLWDLFSKMNNQKSSKH
ncbi:RNA methyltransferase [Marinifilum sp.]|uniref:RNA methyltransferase n=1 Tax=Marinifilum sp. TaxID=2033137 RepID=UPI003BAAE19C